VDLFTAGVSIGGSLISAGGGAWIVNAIRRRRAAPIDATVRLTDAAMKQVDQLQERVLDAEATTQRTQQRLHEVEQEAEDAKQQVRAIRRECADLAERMATLARWIHDPYMTIEQLRTRVPLTPGANGR
jgi:chromosome segregation ATPase